MGTGLHYWDLLGGLGMGAWGCKDEASHPLCILGWGEMQGPPEWWERTPCSSLQYTACLLHLVLLSGLILPSLGTGSQQGCGIKGFLVLIPKFNPRKTGFGSCCQMSATSDARVTHRLLSAGF